VWRRFNITRWYKGHKLGLLIHINIKSYSRMEEREMKVFDFENDRNTTVVLSCVKWFHLGPEAAAINVSLTEGEYMRVSFGNEQDAINAHTRFSNAINENGE